MSENIKNLINKKIDYFNYEEEGMFIFDERLLFKDILYELLVSLEKMEDDIIVKRDSVDFSFKISGKIVINEAFSFFRYKQHFFCDQIIKIISEEKFSKILDKHIFDEKKDFKTSISVLELILIRYGGFYFSKLHELEQKLLRNINFTKITDLLINNYINDSVKRIDEMDFFSAINNSYILLFICSRNSEIFNLVNNYINKNLVVTSKDVNLKNLFDITDFIDKLYKKNYLKILDDKVKLNFFMENLELGISLEQDYLYTNINFIKKLVKEKNKITNLNEKNLYILKEYLTTFKMKEFDLLMNYTNIFSVLRFLVSVEGNDSFVLKKDNDSNVSLTIKTEKKIIADEKNILNLIDNYVGDFITENSKFFDNDYYGDDLLLDSFNVFIKKVISEINMLNKLDEKNKVVKNNKIKL